MDLQTGKQLEVALRAQSMGMLQPQARAVTSAINRVACTMPSSSAERVRAGVGDQEWRRNKTPQLEAGRTTCLFNDPGTCIIPWGNSGKQNKDGTECLLKMTEARTGQWMC